MKDKTIIMHISDLHFGIEKKHPEVKEYRKRVLSKFIDNFSDMINKHPEWAPDILVISGDIAWDGSLEDYKEAAVFFNEFIDRVKGNKIKREDVIVCFGNHDVHASCMKAEEAMNSAYDSYLNKLVHRPEPNCDFNSYYNFELDVDKRYHRFHNAENFCKEMVFTELKTGVNSKYHYAYGSRNVKGINFICLNTEWDFWGKEDENAEGRLRIGSHLCFDVAANFGNCLYERSTPPRFVVYHRPLEFLHKQEHYIPGSYDSDKRVGNIIVRRNDVSLNGHTHEKKIINDGATHTIITADSIHTDQKWEFSCNLIFVPQKFDEGSNECERWLYEYHPKLDNAPWQIGETTPFYIYRYENSENVDEFIANWENWKQRKNRNININQLKETFNLLRDKERVLITILGEEEFREIQRVLSEKKKRTKLETMEKGIKYDSPKGGNTIEVEKDIDMVKEKNLGPYETSSGGTVPHDPHKE
jgi:predicted phosphodiesterase